MFSKTIFSRIILIYLLLLEIQAENTIKIIDYQEKLPPDTFPYDIIPKNAEKFVQIIQNTNENVIIFPEYALTTTKPLSLVKTHLEEYQLFLKIGENLCNDSQQGLKLIGCAAKQYSKDIVLTVVEKSGDDFYSTVIHIDKTGTLKNSHKKEIVMDEIAIKASENNSRIFNINGENYVIFMGYEVIGEKVDPKYKKIIYFPPLSAASAIIFYPIPLNFTIYSVPQKGYNKMSHNNTLNFTQKNLEEVSQECKIEWKAKDQEAVKNNYKIVTYSGKINETKGEVKVCGLLSITEKTTNFEYVKVSIDQKDFVVSGASLKNDQFQAIEANAIESEKSGGGATIKNVDNLLAFTIITTGSAAIANLSFFIFALSLTLKWLF